MARLWTDGAELQSTGTLDHSDSGTAPAISTTTKHSGAASYRINASGSSIWFGQQYKASDSSTQAWFRAYVYFATLPAAEAEIMSLWTTGGSRQLNITVDNAGAMRMRDSGGTQKGSTSSALSTSTWYRIEFTSTVSAGSAVMEARIDGAAFATASNGNVGNHSRFLLGCPAAGQTYDIYYDDIAVNDSSGSAQTSWPGAGSVVYIRPDGQGDNNAWLHDSGGAGDANNYTECNETTPNDATSYVKRTSTGAKVDDYACGSSSGAGIGATDLIKFVAVGARVGALSATATGRNYAARIKSQASGTVTTGATAACNINGWTTHVVAAPKNYQLTSYTDPQAGGAWTPSLLDTMQIGVTTVTSSANEIRVSTVWAVVEYIPSTSITPDAVAVPMNIPAPTITPSYSVTPSAVAASIAIPDPTVTLSGGSVTISPDAVTVPLVVPAPTVTLGALTLTPDPVSVPLVIPAPTVASTYALAPDPVAVPLVVATPTVSLGALTLTPDPTTIPVVIPAPTIARSLALVPDPVAVPLVIPAPAVALSYNLAPDPVAVPLALPDPTITVSGASTNITPDPVAIPIAVPAPTIALSLPLAPDPVAVPIAIPAPAVSLSLTLAPDPVVISLVVPAPTIALSIALTPDPVAVPLVIPAPTITQVTNIALTPDPVAVILVIPAPTITVAGGTPVVVVGTGAGFVSPPAKRREPEMPPEWRRIRIRPLPVVVNVSEIRYAQDVEDLLLVGAL